MTAAVARATLERWRADPVAFVRECFDAGDPVEPDAWQLEALRAFPRSPRLAFKACKGPGKTAVLSWLILNFLVTRPLSKIGCTSITGDNLRDNLWAELAKWRARSRFLQARTTWNATRITVNDAPEQWFATARQWPKQADPQRQADTLAGLHADYVMFALDESGGIPQAVMATAEAVLSSCVEGHVVQAGNATSTTGPLYRACQTDRHLWYVVTITGDPERAEAWVHGTRAMARHVEGRLCSCPRCWATQQIQTYGRDNPWVMVNVLGEFPPGAFNALLTTDDVERAMRRHLRAPAYEWAQKRLGVDVARAGDDRTVLFPRQGLAAFMPTVMRHKHADPISMHIATGVLQYKTRWGSELEFIDATGGWAAGARDALITAGSPPIEVYFHRPSNDDRYENMRAEFWFAMAQWVKGGGALPPVDKVPELVPELTEPTYTFTARGKFAIERKEDVKERLGRSPDLADALGVTFAMPEMPREVQALAGGPSRRAIAEWDPFADR